MNAPLPEVPPQVPEKRAYPRTPTHALTIVSLLQAILHCLIFYDVVSENGNDPRLIVDNLARYARLYGQLLGFVLFAIPIYFLWRGFSWARAITLWLVVLSLAFRFSYLYQNERLVDLWHSANLVEILALIFDIFLLVWLNLPAVKAHFARRNTVKSN